MPERITKDGIQQLPPRRRPRPLHPGIALLLGTAGIALPIGIMLGAMWVAQTFPTAFPYVVIAIVIVVFVVSACLGLR